MQTTEGWATYTRNAYRNCVSTVVHSRRVDAECEAREMASYFGPDFCEVGITAVTLRTTRAGRWTIRELTPHGSQFRIDVTTYAS